MRAADLTHEIADLRLEVWRSGRGRYRLALSRCATDGKSSRYRNDFRWNDLPDLARMLEELFASLPPNAKRRPTPWAEPQSRFDASLSHEEALEALRRDSECRPAPWPQRSTVGKPR